MANISNPSATPRGTRLLNCTRSLSRIWLNFSPIAAGTGSGVSISTGRRPAFIVALPDGREFLEDRLEHVDPKTLACCAILGI
jgi:hypothetical protein